MILSGHQPVYLAGLILFDKIAKSDIFMFVPHCQYSPRSWQTRNRIRTGTLSVPVQKDMGQSIAETKISGDHWKRKHLAAITQAYGKRPYFKDYFPELEAVIRHPWKYLGDMNMALTCLMMPWFGITTKVCYSNEFVITGHKTDMLISMCKAVGADVYLSNEGARAYVKEPDMLAAGITHQWQHFIHPVYEQGGKFMPNLSAIDLAFNLGPKAKEAFLT